jgi:hypothetical protein
MPLRRYTTEELQNKKYHHLTLKKEIREKNRIYWLCQCDCGNLVKRREGTIIDGKTVSCGCKHPRHYKNSQCKQWSGYGDISGHYFSTLKTGAKNRNIEFNITIQEIWDLFVKQKGQCALSNLPLQFSGQRQIKKGVEQTASLDRIDSSKGYTIDNVQWLHKDVNKMKNGYSQHYFLEICRLILSTNSPQKYI